MADHQAAVPARIALTSKNTSGPTMNEGFRSRSDIMRAFVDAAARRFDIDRKELLSLHVACAGSDHRWVEARDWEPAVDFINDR